MTRGGRPQAIPDDRLDEVRAVVADRRGATVQELCGELERRTGIEVCTVTMHRALTRAGPKRTATRQVRAAPQVKRFGYTASHRRCAPADRCASTNATSWVWLAQARMPMRRLAHQD